MAVRFIVGGNRRTRRKPPTCHVHATIEIYTTIKTAVFYTIFNEEYADLSILYWILKLHKNPFMHLEKGILRFLPLVQQKCI
jgi:hypothetical protein